MCGFLLIIDKNLNVKRAEKALNLINHRGPDEQKIISEDKIFMGFNRLAIQDLSNNASQPMKITNKNGEIFIMFNGEIYNFLEIKKSDPVSNYFFLFLKFFFNDLFIKSINKI